MKQKRGKNVFQSHGRRHKVEPHDITHTHNTTHRYTQLYINPMKYHPLLHDNDYKNNYTGVIIFGYHQKGCTDITKHFE